MTALPIKHSAIRLGSLMTWDACQDALDGMDMHPANFCGGLKAFNSCGKIEFTDVANRMRQAIRAKMKTMDCEDDD